MQTDWDDNTIKFTDPQGYEIENNRLVLTFGDGAGRMIFANARADE